MIERLEKTNGESERAGQSLIQSFRCAWAGLRHLVSSERNAKIHLTVALLVIGLGIWLHLSGVEWSLLVLAIGTVFAAEAINTAFEALVDLVSPEYHAFARTAKDTCAAAVLCLAIVALIVGLLVLAPPLAKTLCLSQEFLVTVRGTNTISADLMGLTPCVRRNCVRSVNGYANVYLSGRRSTDETHDASPSVSSNGSVMTSLIGCRK